MFIEYDRTHYKKPTEQHNIMIMVGGIEMEETKKKKKKSWILVTILIIILLVAATLGGYLAGASRIANDVVKQRNESGEAVEKVSNLYYNPEKIENKVDGQKFDNLSIASKNT